MSRNKLRLLKFDWGLESWSFDKYNCGIDIHFSHLINSISIRSFKKTEYLEECEYLFKKLIRIEENEHNRSDRNKIKNLLARHITSHIFLRFCNLAELSTSDLYNSLSKNNLYENLLHDVRYHMVDTCVDIWFQHNIKKLFLEELSSRINEDELKYYECTGNRLKYVVIPINGDMRCENPFEMMMVKSDNRIPYNEIFSKFFKNKYNGEYNNLIINKECNQLIQMPFDESLIPFI